MKNEIKQNWQITISGGCKTFKGFELIEKFTGTHFEADRKRARLEKETGRIMYLALADTEYN
jgi:hypothetical protein